MDQPTEIKKSEQIGGIIILSLLVIIGLIFFIINPQLANLKKNNLQATAKKMESQEKVQKVENLKALQSKFAQSRSTLNKLSVALPKGEKVGEILVQLEVMANKSGVAVISYSPSMIMNTTDQNQAQNESTNQAVSANTSSSSSEQIQIGTYSFNISVEGKYSAIVKFLKNTEVNLRPLKITKAELAGGDGDDPVIIASFYVETYYQK